MRPPSYAPLLVAIAAGAALLASCAPRPSVWTGTLAISGPHEVADRVMWVDGTRGFVFALHPAPQPPTVARVAIDPHVTWASPSPSRKKLFVLTAGQDPRTKSQRALQPALTIVGAAASGPIVERV